VTIPLEDALASLEGIENITSSSRDNFSLVKLELKASAKADEVLQNASRKMLSACGEICRPDARPPVLSRFDFNDLPIIRLAAFSDIGILKLTRFCKKTVIPAISQINGVADVEITGGMDEEVMISVDADRLRLYNVSLLQVLKAVGQANKNVPAGSVESLD